MTAPARTVFLGTGSFAVPVLAALAEHSAVDLRAIVTAPARPAGRGRSLDPPVATWASERDVPLLRPTRLRSPDSVAQIAALEPELLVLADYGQIVPDELLGLPRHGALNLHPSLLPRHRGATPIPAAILAGDAETGVTLIRMDSGLDTGPIVAQWRFPLGGRETAPELEHQLAEQAGRLLGATLEHWLTGTVRAHPQPATGATLTRPLRRADGRLDPARSAVELERQVRAYQPWPGSFLEMDGDRLIVWRAHVRDESSAPSLTGQADGLLLRTDGDALAVVTRDGLLELDEVQPAGGRRMTGAELLRGRPALPGARIVSPAEPGGRG